MLIIFSLIVKQANFTIVNIF